jgi:PAS domain S-box-containing protein
MARVGTTLSDDERYRLLIESVTDYAIYMLDPNGIVTSWNPGARRFKGYEASEIIGQHFSRFYTEEDRASGLPGRALQIATEEGRFENEGWRVRKDGTPFWTHVVIDAIRAPSGEILGFAKITRDLTERKRAEELLRRSEEQFKILVQGVTDYAIYMLDPEGRVASWNAGAQRIKGYQPEEIIGHHFSRFYSEEDLRSGVPRQALETAAREGRFEKEGWRVRKDGTRFWANVVIDAIRDSVGEIIGFAKVTRDVTEKQEAQRALEEAREALFQSQKMEAVGQLTGGIAHDFNNLLSAVLGSLELLQKRLPDDPRAHRLIENAVNGAQRGAALTQRMLAFARRQDLKPEAVDLPALVRGMTELLQTSLGPAITVEARFPLALSLVEADTNKLELAILNLAVNARDAMPNGGSVVIAARESSEPPPQSALRSGAYVCLSVTDQGIGMDEETLARATEPFFTTKGVGKGTGLGLSMVHGMAEQSKGRLILRSRPGEGTTAELWLPVAAAARAKLGPGQESAEQTAKGRTRPLSVLAVDDDALVLMNTSAMLEDLGHTVFEAKSGAEALRILRATEVDLVITDQAMPHMTGAQLAVAIKSEWPRIPVIIATGYAEMPPDAANLPRISKPFRQADIAQAVASATAGGAMTGMA